ncbi:MAG TPA: hypothetical protein VHV49_07570 [Pseudonocardiaceae bacterium]|jgi:hypothetical protein|nr:hypothetical protein [Pseudonocardiaceae bacterium]
MTEPEQPGPEQLLAKALETLPSADRERVTAWLLARTSTGGSAGRLGKPERDYLLSVLSPGSRSLRQVFGMQYGTTLAGQGNQVVPVRLPTELHARLRDWSAEHGFSMATVVRGLVSRFLDGQDG